MLLLLVLKNYLKDVKFMEKNYKKHLEYNKSYTHSI